MGWGEMNTYEEIIDNITQTGGNVIELDLDTDKPCGKCVNGTVFINNRGTNREKLCILIEELGHSKLTVGDIMDLKAPFPWFHSLQLVFSVVSCDPTIQGGHYEPRHDKKILGQGRKN